MSCVFLCRACFPDPKEVKTLGIPRRECDYCGAVCSNVPELLGLPPGDLVNASDAPAPRALSRQEVEAQVRPAPEPVEPKSNPFIALENRCGLRVEYCGGTCDLVREHSGDHVCNPDPETGEETCPA